MCGSIPASARRCWLPCEPARIGLSWAAQATCLEVGRPSIVIECLLLAPPARHRGARAPAGSVPGIDLERRPVRPDCLVDLASLLQREREVHAWIGCPGKSSRGRLS